MSFPCLFWACCRKFLLKDLSLSRDQSNMSLPALPCSYPSLTNDSHPLCMCAFQYILHVCKYLCLKGKLGEGGNLNGPGEEKILMETELVEQWWREMKKTKLRKDRSNWRGGMRYSIFFLCWSDYFCCSRYFLCLQSVCFHESQTPDRGAYTHAKPPVYEECFPSACPRVCLFIWCIQKELQSQLASQPDDSFIEKLLFTSSFTYVFISLVLQCLVTHTFVLSLHLFL